MASFYVIGAVIGALGFGWLTDRFGRRFVFYVTLIVYLTSVLLSAFAWDLWSKSTGRDLLPAHDNLEVHPGKVFGVGLILTSMLGRYRQRSILALVLIVA